MDEQARTRTRIWTDQRGRDPARRIFAEYGLLQNRLAKAIGISPNRIAEIVNNRRRITADAALRLALYSGNSAEVWITLQAHYLKSAKRKLSPATAARISARRAA